MSMAVPFGGDMDKGNRVIIAHGVLACLAFVIFFPASAITIRLARFSGAIWVHAALNAFALMLYIAAVGLGIYFAKQTDQVCAYEQSRVRQSRD